MIFLLFQHFFLSGKFIWWNRETKKTSRLEKYTQHVKSKCNHVLKKENENENEPQNIIIWNSTICTMMMISNAPHTRCDVIPKEKPIFIVHIYGWRWEKQHIEENSTSIGVVFSFTSFFFFYSFLYFNIFNETDIDDVVVVAVVAAVVVLCC